MFYQNHQNKHCQIYLNVIKNKRHYRLQKSVMPFIVLRQFVPANRQDIQNKAVLQFAIILLSNLEFESLKPSVYAGLRNSGNYSHSTNPIIWDCIFYVFTDKLFANLLMFHLLFLAAQFLSIKIVSQKAEKCNHIPRLFQITSHFSLILFFDMF